MLMLAGWIAIAGGAVNAALAALILAGILFGGSIPVSGAGQAQLAIALSPIAVAAGVALAYCGWQLVDGASWARIAVEILAWLVTAMPIATARMIRDKRVLVLLAPLVAVIVLLHWPA